MICALDNTQDMMVWGGPFGMGRLKAESDVWNFFVYVSNKYIAYISVAFVFPSFSSQKDIRSVSRRFGTMIMVVAMLHFSQAKTSEPGATILFSRLGQTSGVEKKTKAESRLYTRPSEQTLAKYVGIWPAHEVATYVAAHGHDFLL
jgi:hypothetical protein